MWHVITLILHEMPFTTSGWLRERVPGYRAGARTRGQVRSPETKCARRGFRERGGGGGRGEEGGMLAGHHGLERNLRDET